MRWIRGREQVVHPRHPLVSYLKRGVGIDFIFKTVESPLLQNGMFQNILKNDLASPTQAKGQNGSSSILGSLFGFLVTLGIILFLICTRSGRDLLGMLVGFGLGNLLGRGNRGSRDDSDRFKGGGGSSGGGGANDSW